VAKIRPRNGASLTVRGIPIGTLGLVLAWFVAEDAYLVNFADPAPPVPVSAEVRSDEIVLAVFS
jgi:hypothetical protein